MTYEQQVAAAAAALKKGEDANWELARLTYENTNRPHEQRRPGRVSHATWAADVKEASGRRFSDQTSRKYSAMWERFGSTKVRPSWTDAWYELVPRDAGEAMRERATDTHIAKEASPERKRELLAVLLDDPDLIDDPDVVMLLDRYRRGRRGSSDGIPPTFDERCAAWVTRADALLTDGARLANEAEASPSLRAGAHAVLALLIYERLTERQIDVEIRRILDSEGVH